jgi:drug/metabolite transporter (DMT)-like permease
LSDDKTPSTLRIALAFLAIYVVWGSTYVAIKFSLESLPPFLMAAIRFTIAGIPHEHLVQIAGSASS